MKNIAIRPATLDDFSEILRINEETVHFLSPLTMEKLEHLNEECRIHLVAVEDGKVLAFCLAFREGADYDSINYLWFKDHYEKFLYIDRVVVSAEDRKKGLGNRLYGEIFKKGMEDKVPVITAEIDIVPPNPVSLNFHKKFGFHEVGKQEVSGGKKIVSLQAVEINRE